VSQELARRVTRVVTSYVGNGNHLQLDAASLEILIRRAAAGLLSVQGAPVLVDRVRASITPEALISFEDGKPYQRLTRHLAARGLTPSAYRQKWDLPDDYPMVSATFSRRCSQQRARRRNPWAFAAP
jgi:predicted transcriptional regulator